VIATLLRAEGKAHRWSLVVPLLAILAVLAYLTAEWTVPFPMVNNRVAVRLVINVASGLFMLLPLYTTYPELERTLVREASGRLPRACASIALATLVNVPTWTAGNSGQAAVTLFCLVTAASIAAVTVIGELAWAVPLSFGLLAIILDAGGPQRITHAMGAVPPPLAYAILALTIVWYTARGPRQFLT
jgi:hypothetical protein